MAGEPAGGESAGAGDLCPGGTAVAGGVQICTGAGGVSSYVNGLTGVAERGAGGVEQNECRTGWREAADLREGVTGVGAFPKSVGVCSEEEDVTVVGIDLKLLAVAASVGVAADVETEGVGSPGLAAIGGI